MPVILCNDNLSTHALGFESWKNQQYTLVAVICSTVTPFTVIH